jgi:hypothetical protein
MPCCADNGEGYKRRCQKRKDIEAKLIAKGLNPRGNGFLRAVEKAMRK